MIGKEEYKDINEILENKFNDNKFLIAAHRGCWGGNIAQNTKDSAKLAYLSGANIIEIDVAKTKDNKYYAFHTKKEKEILGLDINVEDMQSYEVEKKYILNELLEKSKSCIQTVKEIIDSSDESMIFQIDRSEFYLPEVLEFFRNNFDEKTLKRIMIKCSIKDECLKAFDEFDYKFMLMPILRKVEEIEILEKYNSINLIGIEVIAESEESPTYGSDFIKLLKEKFNVLIQINAIKLSKDEKLYADLDDDISMLVDPSIGWGALLELGADIIQTDWPLYLNLYRKEK